MKMRPVDVLNNLKGHVLWPQSYHLSEDEARTCIEALEQQKTGKWIPVSEGLPEEREWLGTKRFGTTKSDEVYVTLETPDGERFTKHLSFQNGGLSQADQESMRVWFKGAVPIAWMPLPEPYKMNEESKE